MLDTLYEYARCQYDCGNYKGAAEFLYHYRLLSTDPVKNFSALWGKFAAEILVSNWDGAFDDLSRLREYIDGKRGIYQSCALKASKPSSILIIFLYAL